MFYLHLCRHISSNIYFNSFSKSSIAYIYIYIYIHIRDLYKRNNIYIYIYILSVSNWQKSTQILKADIYIPCTLYEYTYDRIIIELTYIYMDLWVVDIFLFLLFYVYRYDRYFFNARNREKKPNYRRRQWFVFIDESIFKCMMQFQYKSLRRKKHMCNDSNKKLYMTR